MVLLSLIFFLASCTEEADWDLNYQEEELIVVEGKITNETRSHEVRLTRPVYERNGVPAPVCGMELAIHDGRILYPLTEDRTRPGVYLTPPDFSGEVEKGYQLRIRAGDGLITAVTYMRAVSPFQFMRPYRVQEDPPLYEVHIADSDGPAIVRLELDWSHVPGYENLPVEETHALIYHYTLGSIDVNRLFPPDQEQVRFPPGTIVYREKESVNGLYEEFLRGMLSETDWRGGVFDVLPGNARTNLSEGAIGYFTASEVIRDTLVIDQAGHVSIQTW
jgi:hypothetical protein